jgi:N-acetylglucosaminyldiphosphoundecaprenol N-acetyl-beta-D-mannosaminyltransferase
MVGGWLSCAAAAALDCSQRQRILIARTNVLGVGVSLINMSMALDRLSRWIADREPQYVSVCTVHTVMECRRNAELRRIVNSAGMVTPDGMPLVWLSRLAGHSFVSRVYGPDLMLAEMAASVDSGHRHFFYGGREGVAERLAGAMGARFPGVRIVGTSTPPFGSAQELCNTQTASMIDAAQPDIVWIGVSTPKQELWMSCMRPLLKAPVLIGVGAAFDFHAGNQPQAPRWMQRAGLEWLFRLLHEPRRLWRRYLVDNPWFLFELARQKLGLKRYPLV